MILWKCPIEITKEIKRQKGNNYKGRDIGPFIRQCNYCNSNTLEYPTYDIMNTAEKQDIPCKSCSSGTKGKVGKYSRKCGNTNCNEIIWYKYISDYKSGLTNNTICQKCKNDKNSKCYKGKGIKGHLIEKYGESDGIKKFVEAEEKRVKTFKKHFEDNPEKLKELISKRTKRRKQAGYEMFKTEEARKKNSERTSKKHEEDPTIRIKQSESAIKKFKENPELKNKLSEARKKWIAENPDLHEKMQEKAQRKYKKNFIVNSIRCQGTSEKYYIEYLLKNNLSLPKRCKAVRTSLGLYFPDFEYEDRYIEIKSTFTYKLLKEEGNRQYLKIIETANNVKPVEIIVINNPKKIIMTEFVSSKM